MRVWVERAACQGSELCVELAAAMFATDDEYVCYLKPPGGEAAVSEATALEVPAAQEEGVLRAARECPAQCIQVV